MISIYSDKKFKIYLWQVTLIFCGFLIFGMLCGYFAPHDVAAATFKYVVHDSASAKIINISNEEGPKSLLYFFNNSIVALLLVVIPTLYFKLIGNSDGSKWRIDPIWISRMVLIIQAVSIGVIIGYAAPIINNNLLVITSLLPHGIIEITAFLIASAMGVWFISEENIRNIIGYKGLIKLFIIYVSPTLFIAAMIESYITPYLMSIIMSVS